jgi:copper(I)-binding protein
MTKVLASAVALLVLAACTPPAASPPASEAPTSGAVSQLVVSDGFTRETPQGAPAAGGFITIRNDAPAADRLISAASPRAGRVELHDMSMENGIMQMRPVESIEIAPGATVSLAPGGLHMMLLDLPSAFAPGEMIPITLTFEQAGVIETALTVQPLNPAAGAAPAAEAHDHSGHQH